VLLTGKRRERTIERVKTPVSVLAVLVVVAVVGLFMIFPTAVMIYKLLL
jgi:type II secretory pathway component PulF